MKADLEQSSEVKCSFTDADSVNIVLFPSGNVEATNGDASLMVTLKFDPLKGELCDVKVNIRGASNKLSPWVWRNCHRHLKLLEAQLVSLLTWFAQFYFFRNHGLRFIQHLPKVVNDFAEHFALEINSRNNWIVSKTFKY